MSLRHGFGREEAVPLRGVQAHEAQRVRQNLLAPQGLLRARQRRTRGAFGRVQCCDLRRRQRGAEWMDGRSSGADRGAGCGERTIRRDHWRVSLCRRAACACIVCECDWRECCRCAVCIVRVKQRLLNTGAGAHWAEEGRRGDCARSNVTGWRGDLSNSWKAHACTSAS